MLPALLDGLLVRLLLLRLGLGIVCCAPALITAPGSSASFVVLLGCTPVLLGAAAGSAPLNFLGLPRCLGCLLSPLITSEYAELDSEEREAHRRTAGCGLPTAVTLCIGTTAACVLLSTSGVGFGWLKRMTCGSFKLRLHQIAVGWFAKLGWCQRQSVRLQNLCIRNLLSKVE